MSHSDVSGFDDIAQFRPGAYVCQCPARLPRLSADERQASASHVNRLIELVSSQTQQPASLPADRLMPMLAFGIDKDSDVAADFEANDGSSGRFKLTDRQTIAELLLARDTRPGQDEAQHSRLASASQHNNSNTFSQRARFRSFVLGAELDSAAVLNMLVRSGDEQGQSLFDTAGGDLTLSPHLNLPQQSCRACANRDAQDDSETPTKRPDAPDCSPLADDELRNANSGRFIKSWLRPLVLVGQVVCIVLTLMLIGIILRIRKSRTIIVSGWLMLETMLLGALLLYASVLVRYFQATSLTCLLEPWLRELGFSTFYGSILIKLYRILAEFQTRKAHRVCLRDKDQIIYLLAIVFIVIGYMSAWTALMVDGFFVRQDPVELTMLRSEQVYVPPLTGRMAGAVQVGAHSAAADGASSVDFARSSSSEFEPAAATMSQLGLVKRAASIDNDDADDDDNENELVARLQQHSRLAHDASRLEPVQSRDPESSSSSSSSAASSSALLLDGGGTSSRSQPSLADYLVGLQGGRNNDERRTFVDRGRPERRLPESISSSLSSADRHNDANRFAASTNTNNASQRLAPKRKRELITSSTSGLLNDHLEILARGLNSFGELFLGLLESEQKYDLDSDTFVYSIRCRKLTWDYVTESSEIALLLFGIHLVYKLRNASMEVNKEKLILSLAVLIELITSTFAYLVRHSLWHSLSSDHLLVLYAIRCQLTVTLTLVLVFGPKLYDIGKSKPSLLVGAICGRWTLNVFYGGPNCDVLSSSRSGLGAGSGSGADQSGASGVGGPRGASVRHRCHISCEVHDHHLNDATRLHQAMLSNSALEIGTINLADMDPDEIQAELKRVYTQLELLKTKVMRRDNPHISKRRGGRKPGHRKFSLQAFHGRHSTSGTEHNSSQQPHQSSPQTSGCEPSQVSTSNSNDAVGAVASACRQQQQHQQQQHVAASSIKRLPAVTELEGEYPPAGGSQPSGDQIGARSRANMHIVKHVRLDEHPPSQDTQKQQQQQHSHRQFSWTRSTNTSDKSSSPMVAEGAPPRRSHTSANSNHYGEPTKWAPELPSTSSLGCDDDALMNDSQSSGEITPQQRSSIIYNHNL